MSEPGIDKKKFGQFYTTNWKKILKNLYIEEVSDIIIEPFVGSGELIPFCEAQACKNQANPSSCNIQTYDIDPRFKSDQYSVVKQDTIKNPPNYKNATVITNPPYLARNKSDNKQIFDKYKTNDLYKCFMLELIKQQPKSGVLIIPLNFWCGVRKADSQLRALFLKDYKILHLNIFTDSVFNDTDYTVCSFSFVRDPDQTFRSIPTHMVSLKNEIPIQLDLSQPDWIIGHDILNIKQHPDIKFVRIVQGQPKPDGMIQACFHLHALDNPNSKIHMAMGSYTGKKTSRTEASWYWNINLNGKHQTSIANSWNKFLNAKRVKYHSLFLSNYRENNRKRISFDLAVKLLNAATQVYLKRSSQELKDLIV